MMKKTLINNYTINTSFIKVLRLITPSFVNNNILEPFSQILGSDETRVNYFESYLYMHILFKVPWGFRGFNYF